MKKITRNLALASLGVFVASQIVCLAIDASKPTQAEGDALMAIIHVVNHGRDSLPYRTVVTQQMATEANHFASHLNLPMSLPLQIDDIKHINISLPWFSIITETNYPHFPATIYGRDIANTNIPLELRLRALKFAISGRIDTTNFEFGFMQGKLSHVMRLDSPNTEYYARRLDELVGKSSLIDTNGAYQLATQWLAAVDMDMVAIAKLKWTVNQLHYKTHGATNYVDLPLYYVDFGNKHYPASGNLHAYDEPLVSVEILGTTKTLQELLINDHSFSHRPLLLITNALDLIRTPNSSLKLQNPATLRTPTPMQVSNYSRNFTSPTVRTN